MDISLVCLQIGDRRRHDQRGAGVPYAKQASMQPVSLLRAQDIDEPHHEAGITPPAGTAEVVEKKILG